MCSRSNPTMTFVLGLFGTTDAEDAGQNKHNARIQIQIQIKTPPSGPIR
jgi:hypothetical protein